MEGLHIAYQEAVDGPFDLVYVTSFISNVECVWDVPDQGDFLRRLAGLSRLIVFDRRGAGLSDWPPTAESLAFELSMADVSAVMDAAGSERAVLFGWEEGGTLSALFAVSYPERCPPAPARPSRSTGCRGPSTSGRCCRRSACRRS